MNGCFRVLHHHTPVLVIHVGECKSGFREFVEKGLFRGNIIGKRLVEVQMVMGDVAEDSSGKAQSGHTMLAKCVRTHLHKAVFAMTVHHLREQLVEFHSVGSGVRGRDLLIPDFIHYRGEQTCLVTGRHEQTVQKRHCRGLAVGTGNADQFQLAARMVVIRIRQLPQRHRAVRHLDVANLLVQSLRQCFTNHRTTPLSNRRSNVLVPIGLCTTLCHIKLRTSFRLCRHAPRIKQDLRDFNPRISRQLTATQRFQQYI